MNPETLRRFYRIRRVQAARGGGLVSFIFKPRDGRYPRLVYELDYNVRAREFSAVTKSYCDRRVTTGLARSGSPCTYTETAPLIAALPAVILSDLVTRSIEAQASPEPKPSPHALHGVHLIPAPRVVVPVVVPAEIPPLTNIKFTLKRDSAAFDRLAAELLAEMKETTDATETGHRKQNAGREDGAHVRATVLRSHDRSERNR